MITRDATSSTASSRECRELAPVVAWPGSPARRCTRFSGHHGAHTALGVVWAGIEGNHAPGAHPGCWREAPHQGDHARTVLVAGCDPCNAPEAVAARRAGEGDR